MRSAGGDGYRPCASYEGLHQKGGRGLAPPARLGNFHSRVCAHYQQGDSSADEPRPPFANLAFILDNRNCDRKSG